MMENYSIKDLMKANNLRRWHTVDVVKEQSLSEHQWNVTMIAIQLAKSIGLDDHSISQLTTKALTHDMEEIWTGDLPSPYKEELRREAIHGKQSYPGAKWYGDKCSYCESPAECLDHVGTGPDTVSSCILCNSILADHPSYDMAERTKICQDRYRNWINYNTKHIRKHGRDNIELKLTGGPSSHVESTPGRSAPTPLAYQESTSGAVGSTSSDSIIRAADLIDAVIWSNKYVLEDSVVQDCAKRLQKFQIDCMGDDLNKAIAQIMTELLH